MPIIFVYTITRKYYKTLLEINMLSKMLKTVLKYKQ